MMYGRGFGLAHQYAAASTYTSKTAYYSDVVRYTENGRKTMEQFVATPDAIGYTVSRRTSRDRFLLREFASTQEVGHVDNLADALGLVKATMFATMEEKKGRIEVGSAPMMATYTLDHTAEGEKLVKAQAEKQAAQTTAAPAPRA